MEKVYLLNWYRVSNHVELHYRDGSVVVVSYEDFNRAFFAIITADKQSVIRDFSTWQIC